MREPGVLRLLVLLWVAIATVIVLALVSGQDEESRRMVGTTFAVKTALDVEIG